MKKILSVFAIVLAIAASAFTAPTEVDQSNNQMLHWFDKNTGEYLGYRTVPAQDLQCIGDGQICADGYSEIDENEEPVQDNGSITIDASAKKVTESSCAGSTGSISGLIVNGGNIFKWINTADNTIVANTTDVSALPRGNYSLTVTNNLGCRNTSPLINIPQSTFSAINVTGAAVSDALCESPTGSIKINTFSKDHSNYTFSWIDEATGQVAGAGLSLNNLNPGTFSLMARDGNSCEKKIYTATIKAIPKPVLSYNSLQVKDDNCNLKGGSISGMQVTGLKGPTVYTWYDQDNNIAGNG